MIAEVTIDTFIGLDPVIDNCNYIKVPHCWSCGKAIDNHSTTNIVACRGKRKDGTECGALNRLA